MSHSKKHDEKRRKRADMKAKQHNMDHQTRRITMHGTNTIPPVSRMRAKQPLWKSLLPWYWWQ